MNLFLANSAGIPAVIDGVTMILTTSLFLAIW
jgi:hypothetical protein